MKRVVLLGLLGIVFIAINGCASISYKPSLSLGESPYTVHAMVQINQFKDVTPPEEKEKRIGGTSVTEPGCLAGNLATEVTNAVLVDFSSNQVFDTIKKRINDPDLIMNGTIYRFYGKAGMDGLGWVTMPVDLIWFLGLPIQSSYGAVDIEISFKRPNGTSVATFRGVSKFSNYYSIYTNAQLAIGSRVNKAFSDAMRQIRSQILADSSELSARTAAMP